jgi:hypothetical protein
MFVYGGYDGARCNDCYELHFGAKQTRSFVRCVRLAFSHFLYLRCGARLLYARGTDTLKWRALSLAGRSPFLSEHSSVVYNDKMYVFGGALGANGLSNELYEFDSAALVVRVVTTKGTRPAPRMGHVACIYGTNRMVLVCRFRFY